MECWEGSLWGDHRDGHGKMPLEEIFHVFAESTFLQLQVGHIHSNFVFSAKVLILHKVSQHPHLHVKMRDSYCIFLGSWRHLRSSSVPADPLVAASNISSLHEALSMPLWSKRSIISICTRSRALKNSFFHDGTPLLVQHLQPLLCCGIGMVSCLPGCQQGQASWGRVQLLMLWFCLGFAPRSFCCTGHACILSGSWRTQVHQQQLLFHLVGH